MTAKQQARVLVRAWEGGAFDSVVARWKAVRELRVASATSAQLAEAVAASQAVDERIEDLLGEPPRKGLASALSVFSWAGRQMKVQLSLEGRLP